MRVHCPSGFLSTNFQCINDVFELQQMFWNCLRLLLLTQADSGSGATEFGASRHTQKHIDGRSCVQKLSISYFWGNTYITICCSQKDRKRRGCMGKSLSHCFSMTTPHKQGAKRTHAHTDTYYQETSHVQVNCSWKISRVGGLSKEQVGEEADKEQPPGQSRKGH